MIVIMENVKSTNYGNLSYTYNAITKIISSGGNQRSQSYFLKLVNPHQRILNVGCGSVQFSTELSRKCKNVTCLDISDKMLTIAKRYVVRNGNIDNISIICSDIMEYSTKEQFDIVFANFFLNTFYWTDCQKALKKLTSLVKPKGLLCIADETEGKHRATRLAQLIVRPLVVWFHHIIADHPFHPIYDYTPTVISLGFSLIERERDKTDYICSTIYQKI